MLYLLLIINIIAFITFAWDKWKAVKHKRRISEAFLFTLIFLGGTIGAILGMLIFRHKISKRSFLIKTALIILLQLLIMISLKSFIINQLTN
ncbi:DUF1294 domain-containing protein [Chryseobacterium formosus]|uniref:DUF1294 domain-containing protein n=1 Tax=Chryseobacterium formosus TaxID=1537363 RepID=A0ABT3XLX6_9FLAO|nr:DUF1294 domain-containing protein [Chryseobacterium formosus]MCX8523131.1 DUF1294 domain-containing protein [Chryseobacterium formosus]